jgi:hypothetical protein
VLSGSHSVICCTAWTILGARLFRAISSQWCWQLAHDIPHAADHLHNHETLQDVDEDELAAELEELEASELDKELLEPAPVPVTKVRLPIG